MADPRSGVQTLYSGSGDEVGVYIPADVWAEVKSEVLPCLQKAHKRLQGAKHQAEPMQDWELLVSNWDFRYPVNREVVCGQCGSSTSNWEEDDPRKFRLKAASLGGLVVFECQKCRSRVTKRHFKDTMKMETTPIQGT
ncbi:MAG: hypothetical protein ACOCQT_01790 [Desulfovermiculus sp.]